MLGGACRYCSGLCGPHCSGRGDRQGQGQEGQGQGPEQGQEGQRARKGFHWKFQEPMEVSEVTTESSDEEMEEASRDKEPMFETQKRRGSQTLTCFGGPRKPLMLAN